MKNRRSDREISNHYLNTGKVDRVVQKSKNKEVNHYLETINGGFFNIIKAVIHNIFKFFLDNETTDNMPSFSYVAPDLRRQNNSDKKWYKTHAPKSIRKGLTHRETTTVRRLIHSKKRKYV